MADRRTTTFDTTVFDAVASLLRAHEVDARYLDHPAIHNAEHAAKLRGLPLAAGAKAVLVKAGSGDSATMQLVAFSAARRLDSRALRRALRCSKLRFATEAELWELTGLVPGSVPPLGRPVLPVDLLIDESLARQPVVAFTPGLKTRSVILSGADYLRITQPKRAEFTRPAPAAGSAEGGKDRPETSA